MRRNGGRDKWGEVSGFAGVGGRGLSGVAGVGESSVVEIGGEGRFLFGGLFW